MQTRQITQIPIHQLVSHPANPNEMPKTSFNKLLAHIKRSGNYEPLVVRKHPVQNGSFQILNGHHRLKALQKLQVESADCVVWDVDDDEANILLLTLNRLQGKDDIYKKAELIKQLSERFDIKHLISQLNQSRKNIEHLMRLNTSINRTAPAVPQFLTPFVFYFDDGQKQLVEKAIAAATEPQTNSTGAQRKAKAVAAICEKYLQTQEGN
ncbi:MAG: ParB/RepB/Spo0J family partition protein [Anaerohalosphaera sp.]|nr:ParB/RepB/Spo0J family partition protein [Anaerohalosphaera sp.]